MSTVVVAPIPVPSPSLAETVSETTVLTGMLRQRSDIKPNLSGTGWVWTETEQYPPVARIEKTPFWQHQDYEPIRQRLQRAAPVVDVDEGGDFSTIRTSALRRDPQQPGAVTDRHRIVPGVWHAV